jgi:hypothetical protein
MKIASGLIAVIMLGCLSPGVGRGAPQPSAAAGVSGNAVGRHTSSSAVVGGPAKYDAKKGAVINGTAMRRKV